MRESGGRIKASNCAFRHGANGKSRGFAQLMKKKLECMIGPEYGDLLDVVEAERLVAHGAKPGKSPSYNGTESVASLLPDEAAHNRLPKLHDGL